MTAHQGEFYPGETHRGALRQILANPVVVYTILGGLFGLSFPIVALFINILEMGLKPEDGVWLVITQVHQRSILQWLIDTAPLVLAAFAYLAGRRQQDVLGLNRRLTRFVEDRDQLITQLQKTAGKSEQEAQLSLVQLSTAAQIARQSTSLSAEASGDTLSELLAGSLEKTARLISAQFGYYHVGIFISDAAYLPAGARTAQSSERYAYLVATNSSGGQKMLHRGHRLKIGGAGVGVGIVGYVAAEGKPKIALDVGAEAVYFDNPDLPETRSEMALPLSVGGKTIGVLDVQSTLAAAFGEREIAVMSLIAESLAMMIENGRLIQELRSSLEDVRRLHQQYLRRAWSEALTTQPMLEYTAKAATDQRMEARAAGVKGPQQGTTESMPNASRSAQQRTLTTPIKLREQVIGEIEITGEPAGGDDGSAEKPGSPADWQNNEIGLVEAVADQAAQALENARLLGETQRRAERERITARIAERVWSFSDIDTILQTALQELGTSLDVSEGVIQLSRAELQEQPGEAEGAGTEYRGQNA